MSNYTLRKLIEQRDALDAQIAPLRAEAREAALQEMKARIAEFEFTAYDLGLVRTQHIKRNGKESPTFKVKAKAPPPAPLYRDPASGKTWSGKGRSPLWMEGNRDDYLILQEQA